MSQGHHTECAIVLIAWRVQLGAFAMVGLSFLISMGCEKQDKCESICLQVGHCTEKAGDCIAATDDDCKQSLSCKEDNLCRALNGRCVLSHEHCETQEACKREGICRANRSRCTVGTDAQCAASEACKTDGMCAAEATTDEMGDESGECVAKTRAHCAPTEGCKRNGQCTPLEGTCRVVERRDCLDTPGCKKEGRCTPLGHSEVDRICLPSSDEDCAQSEGCAKEKKCTFNDRGMIRDSLWGECEKKS